MFAIREGSQAGAAVATPQPVPTRSLLRRVLVGADSCAVAAFWLVVLGPLGGYQGSGTGLLLVVGLITVAAVALLASQQLYLGRVCRLRSVEISRLVRTAGLLTLLVHLLGPGWGVRLTVGASLATAAGLAVALTLSRSAYTSWLQRRRADGRHCRPVVIVGSSSDAHDIEDLIGRHPELGFEAVAIVPPTADVMDALRLHCSDTVVVSAGALPAADLNRLARRLLDSGVHIHLSTGLSGIDQRRLRAQPLGRAPMFYLEPLRISPWQAAVKRSVDIVGSVIGILASLPVLVAAALAIKLEDGGPVLFRHKRVGRNGEEFTLVKLRTMVPDADRQLHLVSARNQRNGPLFKSHDDPRITRVGRLLRATSIDELPQLFNVLAGKMSLVGPRPALAHEVAQFDDELRGRERVHPGITGLWQIEGRDDPSFEAYRRLDMYYVENWSLELDFVILLLTGQAVVRQALQDRRRQWKEKQVARESLHVIELAGTAPEVVP